MVLIPISISFSASFEFSGWRIDCWIFVLSVSAREEIGATEFMISWVITLSNLCHACDSVSSSASLMFWKAISLYVLSSFWNVVADKRTLYTFLSFEMELTILFPGARWITWS